VPTKSLLESGLYREQGIISLLRRGIIGQKSRPALSSPWLKRGAFSAGIHGKVNYSPLKWGGFPLES